MTRVPKKYMSQKRVTIYSLSDPLTEKIFYVGRTTLPLNIRLNSAASSKRVKQYVARLKKRGFRPVIEALDTTDYSNRKRVEEYWIQQISAWGFTLLNTKHYVNKSAYPRVARNTRLSEEEKEIIDILYRHGDNEHIAQTLGVSNELVRFYKNRTTIPKRIKDVVVGYYKVRAKVVVEWYLKSQQQAETISAQRK